MKTFLSWSGNISHSIAIAFSDWIPCVIQAIEPWVSSKDIDRGSIWFNEIFEQLKDTNFGIVFVTKENQGNPWLLFESGALSKGLTENRICTVLVDLSVRDIDSGSPLRQLNHTLLEKDSVLSLTKTINKHLGDSQIKEEHLEKSFNALWEELESNINVILGANPVSDEPKRKDTDVLNDILDNVLNINRKVSRVIHRGSGQYIEAIHAKALLNKLLKMDVNPDVIEEVMEDIVPSHWIRRQLRDIFGEQSEDE